ncbi:MAG: hypothetical protein MUF62_09415 [Chitinophagaceae bacterium]|nr:hypothetical protein [Chitinophagaceae bacterium]
MIPLLQYHKLALLESLMTGARQVFAAYEQRDFHFDDKLKAWLQQCDQFFEQHNGPVERSRIKELYTDFITLLRGTDPYTFTKIESQKRAQELNIGYRIAKQALEVVTVYYEKVDARLKEAEQLIGQLLLAMLQAEMITMVALGKIKTQRQLEALWKKMGEDKQLLVVQKKVLLQISRYDAVLLLEKCLAALRQ